jgi:hypothetical protein
MGTRQAWTGEAPTTGVAGLRGGVPEYGQGFVLGRQNRGRGKTLSSPLKRYFPAKFHITKEK